MGKLHETLREAGLVAPIFVMLRGVNRAAARLTDAVGLVDGQRDVSYTRMRPTPASDRRVVGWRSLGLPLIVYVYRGPVPTGTQIEQERSKNANHRRYWPMTAFSCPERHRTALRLLDEPIGLGGGTAEWNPSPSRVTQAQVSVRADVVVPL